MLDATIADPAAAAAPALRTLVETIEALAATRTVDQVAAVVCSAARRISGADGAAFILREADLCRYVDEDAIAPLWKGRRSPLDQDLAGWAMRRGQTAVVADVRADRRLDPALYRQTFVRAVVMTPVGPVDPIAAVGAYWARPHKPPPAAAAGLAAIAQAAAGALERVRLYAALREAEARHDLLLRELDHRVKNTLASVQSIVSQTLRSARSSDEFSEGFEARLMALSRAHELLTRQAWGGAGLRQILEAALLPFGGLDGARLTASGPAVAIAPETAVALHMTLHELADNAARFGALSTPAGQVSVDWRVAGEGAGRRLVLTWRERGGPPVAPPARRGFGSRMIERGLARDLGGSASLDFAPQGVRFTLRAPLSARVALA